MNKEQYLNRLRSLIMALPDNERETVIDYYREIIDDKVENGKTEEQAVAELGEVQALAQKILLENPNRRHVDMQRIFYIALASFCSIFIVASIVIFALSFNNIPADQSSNAQGSAQAGTGEEKTVTSPAGEITNIVIDAENKVVDVNQSTGESITITYFADKTETNTVTTKDGEMKLVNRDSKSHSFHLFRLPNNTQTTRITVNVPQSFNGILSVETSNGSITVKDVKKLQELTCNTNNADVQLNNVQSESVGVDTNNGEINLVCLDSNSLYANSSNGDISLQEIVSPDITLDTSNAKITGSIRGNIEDYNIHTETSNASCSPSNRSGGSKKLTADTSNGRISIGFIN